MNKVEITCKGSCDGNPGPGAWGIVLTFEDRPKNPIELAVGYQSTTNNRMEMMAVIAALTYLGEHTKQEGIIFTNLELIAREYHGHWADEKWPWHGWRGSNGEGIENIDLWKWIARLRKRHNLQVEHVPEREGYGRGEFYRASALAHKIEKTNIDFYHQNPQVFEDEFRRPRFPAIYSIIEYHQGEVCDTRNWLGKGFFFAWSPTTGDVFVHKRQVPAPIHDQICQGVKIQFKARMTDKERPEAVDVTLLDSKPKVKEG